ncbi:uncharacterized protein LOC141827802 [Curcuma longa]|uniref:uncharacterized protein LOC141827802 n=1 Tax=Curcuma longa TaxID=136217 RepID=UPI003D9E277F
MANTDSVLPESPRVGHRKRYLASEAEEVEKSMEHTKKRRTIPHGAWANLDLILYLQSKDASFGSKIEIAFNYLTTTDDGNDRRPDVIRLPRLCSNLIDWIQPHLISSESAIRNSEICDPSLDYRCWAILKVCLQKSSSSVSPNLLRAITHVLQHALLIAGDCSLYVGDCPMLFKQLFECLSFLHLSNSRTFYNAGVELWVSCAKEVANLVLKVLTNDDLKSTNAEIFLSLAILLLENFSGFLRFHTNPRNVFRPFMDRLLEPLLELFVLLKLRVNEGKHKRVGSLLDMVKEVLSNGLFHPAHIGGFLSFRNSTVEQEGRCLKGINESYHRHFFQRLDKMIAEKKAVPLGGFGYLLCLFINKAKNQNVGTLASKVNVASGKHPEEGEGTSKPLFAVFTQFLKPLVFECRRCLEFDFSWNEDLLEIKLVEGHCMLKSVNEIFASFIDEKIYAPTEDTSEESHFKFLKEICDIIISISRNFYSFWLSILHLGNVRIKKVLPLIAKEIFIAVGSFLEIEYKAVGDELVELWLMMFSYLAVQMPLSDIKPCALLVSEILKLACQLINIYSELRQVNGPIFALCKAVRLFPAGNSAVSTRNSVFVASSSLNSGMCLKSISTLLSSETFQLAMSNSIKSIPERQANGCIQELNIDITDSLEWIKNGQHDDTYVGETTTSNSKILESDLKVEILGRILSEIYLIILDSLTVTVTNSLIVGNSVESLLKGIRPSFSYLVQNPSDGINEFTYCITGQKLLNNDLIQSQNGQQMFPISMSWFFVFIFRVYTSCRSLYRQSISFMPPTSARKASDTMGNLFYVSHGLEWRNKLKFLDNGYFSWIVNPSIPLMNLIQFLSEPFLSSSSPAYTHLYRAIAVMVLQRINDLNRLLKVYMFLQKEGSHGSKILLENSDVRKSSKRLNRLIAISRSEATELTNFLTSNLQDMASHGKCICNQSFNSSETTISLSDGNNLGNDVCSFYGNSLPGQLWLLMCQNIDVWCTHASSKYLKVFLSHLLLYSLPCRSVLEESSIGESLFWNVNMHKVALELISDSILYEQPALFKYLTSRICRALKRSFTDLANNYSASCKHLYSLSEWSEILNTLVQGAVADISGSSSLPVPNCTCSDICRRQPCTSSQIQLKGCEDLLHLLCKMPAVHVTTTAFTDYATYILNIERVLMSILKTCHTRSSANHLPYLLRLFVLCRRAIKHLLVASVENEETLKSSYLFTVFNHSTILWFLKSVDELVGLPHAFFGEMNSVEVEAMYFSLIDHTAYIFLTVSKKLMSCTLQLKVYNEMFDKQLAPQDDTTKEDVYNISDQHFETSGNSEFLKGLEMFAEILADQTRDLTITKDMIHMREKETDLYIFNWNRLSCLMSCLQGFLWGLASATNNMDGELFADNQQPVLYTHPSRLENYFVVFENFVHSCISILFTHTHDKSSCRNIVAETAPIHEEHFFVKNHVISQKQGEKTYNKDPSRDENANHFAIRKGKSSQAIHKKRVINAFKAIYDTNLSNLEHLRVSFIQSLLKGERPYLAFAVRQLFLSSAAILKLRCMFLFRIELESQSGFQKFPSSSMTDQLEISHVILQEIAEMVGRPNQFCFVWLDGILKYLEVIGDYINLTDPHLSKDVYIHFINNHLRAIGKCISLQGKSATLSSHDSGSNTKMLQREPHISVCEGQPLYARECEINKFKGLLRLSFRKFISRPTKLHLEMVVLAIERAMIGMQPGYHTGYEVRTGNVDGSKVSPIVAGGIDGLDLVLEYVSEQKPVIKERISSLVVCLFNIIVHIHHPKIFYVEKLHLKIEVNADAGSVILMCVEVLITIAGKQSFHMNKCHASQCLHVPMVLFKNFCELRDSLDCNFSTDSPDVLGSCNDARDYMVDHEFSVDLYISCCKLLYTTLRHRTYEVEQSIALLQDSVVTLLNCLEIVDVNSQYRKGCFTWGMDEAIKCASFLRRIYEEIRQQKNVVGKFSIYFLSSYVSVYCGFGPLQTGIKREIEEALKPGIYSLIDICTSDDIQQLHTLLNESSCRSTLSALVRDYRLNFRFEGKA